MKVSCLYVKFNSYDYVRFFSHVLTCGVFIMSCLDTTHLYSRVSSLPPLPGPVGTVTDWVEQQVSVMRGHLSRHVPVLSIWDHYLRKERNNIYKCWQLADTPVTHK